MEGNEEKIQEKGRGKRGTQNEDTEDSEVHRLTITRAAEEALQSAVEKINEGFQGGKVNRNQTATWALIRFSERLSNDEIREIRSEHVDEFSAMEAILRRAKGSGQLPSELRAFIQKSMGFEDAPKKKTKKNLQENVTNDYIEDEKAA